VVRVIRHVDVPRSVQCDVEGGVEAGVIITRRAVDSEPRHLVIVAIELQHNILESVGDVDVTVAVGGEALGFADKATDVRLADIGERWR
jgi:hypothetical protein